VFLRPLIVAVALALPASAGVARAASLPGGGAATKPAPSKAAGKPAAKATTKSKAIRYPTVVLYHVNRRETVRLRLYDDRGRPVRMQSQMNQFLRCHYTGRRYPMNSRLIRLIWETGKAFPGRRIEVVSGYRHPKFAKNPRSPHMRGLATDMRVVGIKNTELRDFFRSKFQKVGVGYYPNSSFVHLDVRKGASAFWIDYSGPGETAQYSANAAEDLRSGRADRWRRTTIDPSWADTDDPPAELATASGATSEVATPGADTAAPAMPPTVEQAPAD
jgi:uncharacterized protein YcbK (DUF882 family)